MKTDTMPFGLALSGGGARGIIHSGFLKALDEINLKPEIISGASMGAIVGAMYAGGVAPGDMLKAIKKPELTTLPSWIGRRGGLGSLVVLREQLQLFLKAQMFKDLNIPLIISVTNLNKGCNELITEGPLIDWVVASASIPVIFQPVHIGNYYYVDGGLTNNLPIQCLKNNKRLVVGVQTYNILEVETAFTSIKAVSERSLNLAVNNTISGQMDACDVLIDAPEVFRFGTFDFQHADEIFEIGYQMGLRHRYAIREQIASKAPINST